MSEKQTSEELRLKSCPFCGNDAELDTNRGFIDYQNKPGSAVAIYCVKCLADMTLCKGDFPEHTTETLVIIAATEWNRRTPDPRMVEVRQENILLKQLIVHVWVHSNYSHNGYNEMSEELKAKFDSVTNDENEKT